MADILADQALTIIAEYNSLSQSDRDQMDSKENVYVHGIVKVPKNTPFLPGNFNFVDGIDATGSGLCRFNNPVGGNAELGFNPDLREFGPKADFKAMLRVSFGGLSNFNKRVKGEAYFDGMINPITFGPQADLFMLNATNTHISRFSGVVRNGAFFAGSTISYISESAKFEGAVSIKDASISQFLHTTGNVLDVSNNQTLRQLLIRTPFQVGKKGTHLFGSRIWSEMNEEMRDFCERPSKIKKTGFLATPNNFVVAVTDENVVWIPGEGSTLRPSPSLRTPLTMTARICEPFIVGGVLEKGGTAFKPTQAFYAKGQNLLKGGKSNRISASEDIALYFHACHEEANTMLPLAPNVPSVSLPGQSRAI